MTKFTFHMDNNQPSPAETFQKRKLSFLSNMDDLIEKKDIKKPMKKVNTRIPKQVLTAFLLHCVKENRFRKDVFSEMLAWFLEEYNETRYIEIDSINGESVDFTDLEEANFEFRAELYSKVQELKVLHRLNYKDIYTQVIVQYLSS